MFFIILVVCSCWLDKHYSIRWHWDVCLKQSVHDIWFSEYFPCSAQAMNQTFNVKPEQKIESSSLTQTALAVHQDSCGLSLVNHITQAQVMLLPSECQTQMTDILYFCCCAKNIPNHEFESTRC